MTSPETKKQLGPFLGLYIVYQRFVNDLVSVVAQLKKKLKKTESEDLKLNEAQM